MSEQLPPVRDRHVLVYDIEVFPNWYAVVATNGGKFRTFTPDNIGEFVSKLNDGVILAGFNSHDYDDIICNEWCKGVRDPRTIYNISKGIIAAGSDNASAAQRQDKFVRKYADKPWFASIDVFQLLNGKGSLKEHAARMGADDVRDTPADFDTDLTDALTIDAVLHYCTLDVRNTLALLRANWGKVELRTRLADMFKLSRRVYCLPEQGIAQETMVALYKERNPGATTGGLRDAATENPDNNMAQFPMSSIVSRKVAFQTDAMRAWYEDFRAGRIMGNAAGTSWTPITRSGVEDIHVVIDGRQFDFGSGGIHTKDTSGRFDATDDMLIVDLDVTSYYPSIIINENLSPVHWDGGFAQDLKRIFDLRVAAKRSGDMITSDALKIVANSTFGKLNDLYSPFRSVPDALRVTINGQLFLLMLAEALEMGRGDERDMILSANTDGITIRWSKASVESKLPAIIERWQTITGFNLERSDYKHYWRRDVNNYIAVKTDGKIKTKGVFQPESGKGDGKIVKLAAIAAVQGQDIRKFVRFHEDIRDFVFYRRCQSGGVVVDRDGSDIGKMVRFVISDLPHVQAPLRRRNPDNGKRNAGTLSALSESNGAFVVHHMDQLQAVACAVIDFDWYAAHAEALVASTAFNHKR